MYAAALVKLGLSAPDQVNQSHVSKLSGPQLRAVAFIQCDGVALKGKVDEMRSQLKDFLPVDPDPVDPDAFPEYETQDVVAVYEAEDDGTESSGRDFELTVRGTADW